MSKSYNDGNHYDSEAGMASNTQYQLSNYERLKTVGKGAFGTAVLYRRKHDNLSVIIKQINMLDLTASERQMALNEVKVLSTLHHPNIIKYFNSFEEEGVLMIEMEYADGGTLHDYLSTLEKPMEEITVLKFFNQIALAIQYMHEKHVLHRDLKTVNIFLSRDYVVKIGDFGISKITSTVGAAANTVVGTPYYISPEMCEGKPYNEKSDIWALGCILYEMVCLHRTFEGTNLPALVHKIMKGQFAPIRGSYSHEFRQLVGDLLQQEPTFRPSATDIVQKRLPVLLKQCESETNIPGSSIRNRQQSKRQSRSVLYEMKFQDETLVLCPVPLPAQHLISHFSVSNTHSLALTSDGRVYSWGDNSHHQLGHLHSPPYVQSPMWVQTLNGKIVTNIGAGTGFSLFSCSNGLLMSVGDGGQGCLGHGDWTSISKPKILEKLLGMDITGISCGPHHVVVVGDQRFAFSWGLGLSGRLGHGTEESLCSPTELTFSETVAIRNVRCGNDATVFLTSNGNVWACGSNTNNKIGLNSGGHFWSCKKKDISQQWVPLKLCGLGTVVDVSLGSDHMALLLDNGQVITCGANGDGQLGHGHEAPEKRRKVVDAVRDRVVNILECGEAFTLVGTEDNTLYIWGSCRAEFNSFKSNHNPMNSLVWDVGPPVDSDCPQKSRQKQKLADASGEFNPEITRVSASVTGKKKILKPQEILMLYAAPEQIAVGEMVTLSDLRCQGPNMYLKVATTAPLPHRNIDCPYISQPYDDKRQGKGGDTKLGDSTNSLDETTLIPEWLRQEYEESEKLWQRQTSEAYPSRT